MQGAVGGSEAIELQLTHELGGISTNWCFGRAGAPHGRRSMSSKLMLLFWWFVVVLDERI
jgi:hypothetical protein